MVAFLHVVCALHNITVIAGPGSLLSEYECPVCVEAYDYANRWVPCCSAMNTTCCGHDDRDYRDEDQPKWPGVTIESADYRNTHHVGIDADVPF